LKISIERYFRFPTFASQDPIFRSLIFLNENIINLIYCAVNLIYCASISTIHKWQGSSSDAAMSTSITQKLDVTEEIQ